MLYYSQPDKEDVGSDIEVIIETPCVKDCNGNPPAEGRDKLRALVCGGRSCSVKPSKKYLFKNRFAYIRLSSQCSLYQTHLNC
jgi:hypothetical protein